MLCPRCGKIFSNTNLCPVCKTDSFCYIKTVNISIRLYNRALKKAHEKDLTGAEIDLNNSIIFNKSNYNARNLLGLIYFEKGRIGDALKQWIISSSIFKQNNPASLYIETLQKNSREIEKLNEAVIMYNNALKNLRQKSEDLAIIQLKKIVDINPKFIDAYNLMTICYIMEKNSDKAKGCIEKVLSMDVKNPHALLYNKEFENDLKQKKKDKKQKPVEIVDNTKKTHQNKNYIKNNTTSAIGSSIIAFFVGLVCMTIVFTILIIPSWKDEKDRTIADLKNQVEKFSINSAEYSEELNNIKAENESLKIEIEQYKVETLKQDALNKLQQASDFMTQNDYENSATVIMEIDTAYYDEENLEKYNSLKEKVFPRAARSLYTKGQSEFISGNYEEAQAHLESVLKYSSGENFVDDTIYYLGKIAEKKEDFEKAKEYYNRVMNEYPKSNQYNNSRNSLNALE